MTLKIMSIEQESVNQWLVYNKLSMQLSKMNQSCLVQKGFKSDSMPWGFACMM